MWNMRVGMGDVGVLKGCGISAAPSRRRVDDADYFSLGKGE
jgi:hypothetical protein